MNLSFLSKRDLLIILERCVTFWEDIQYILPDHLHHDYPKFSQKLLFFIEFTNKLQNSYAEPLQANKTLPIISTSEKRASGSHVQSPSSQSKESNNENRPNEQEVGLTNDVVAYQCAQIAFLTSIISLHPLEDGDEVDLIENKLLQLCSRGIHLQEFADSLFVQYLLINPLRFSKFTNYTLQYAPSISENHQHSHQIKDKYILSIPLGRSLVELLKFHYDDYSDNLFDLYYISIYFQCSFEVIIRSIGIELAAMISGRHRKSSALTKQISFIDIPKKPKPSISARRVSLTKKITIKKQTSSTFSGEFQAIIGQGNVEVISKLTVLDPTQFLPISSHMDREIYLGIVKRYISELSKVYELHTVDCLQSLNKITDNISQSTDIALLLELSKPWIRNYGTIVNQPPRRIIRSLFDISLKHIQNPSLIPIIQQLWEELVSADQSTVIPMALDWLSECCTTELKKKDSGDTSNAPQSNNSGNSSPMNPNNQNNNPVIAGADKLTIKVCHLAVMSIIRSTTNSMSQLAGEYLINKLRNYSAIKFKKYPITSDGSNKDVFQLSEYVDWYNAERVKTDGTLNYCPYKEHTALLLLTPLLLGDYKFKFDNYLILILQHAFVLHYQHLLLNSTPNNFPTLPATKQSSAPTSSASKSSNSTTVTASMQANNANAPTGSDYYQIPSGDDLIANLLQGLQSKLSHCNQSKKKKFTLDLITRFSYIRENYFPDSCSKLIKTSLLPSQQPDQAIVQPETSNKGNEKSLGNLGAIHLASFKSSPLHVINNPVSSVPPRSSPLLSSRKPKQSNNNIQNTALLTNIANTNIIYIPYKKITRLVDLLSYS